MRLVDGLVEAIFALREDAAVMCDAARHLRSLGAALRTGRIDAAQYAAEVHGVAATLAARSARVRSRVSPEVQRCYEVGERALSRKRSVA